MTKNFIEASLSVLWLRRTENFGLRFTSHWANLWIWLQRKQHIQRSFIIMRVLRTLREISTPKNKREEKWFDLVKVLGLFSKPALVILDCLLHKGINASLWVDKVFFKPFTFRTLQGEPLQLFELTLMFLSIVILLTIMVFSLMSFWKYF